MATNLPGEKSGKFILVLWLKLKVQDTITNCQVKLRALEIFSPPVEFSLVNLLGLPVMHNEQCGSHETSGLLSLVA